jgi:hypothetical protein
MTQTLYAYMNKIKKFLKVHQAVAFRFLNSEYGFIYLLVGDSTKFCVKQ